MQQNEATLIIEQLGEDRLQTELNWSERLIRHARSSGKISGLWYEPVKVLCDRHGVKCPLSAFSFKAPSKSQKGPAKKNVNANTRFQEAAK